MTDFRALCAELVDDLALCDWPYKLKDTIRADIERARALLAEPDGPAVPDGREPASVAMQPSDEELEAFLVDVACQNGDMYYADPRVLARAVLDRWGRPAAAPVPVSERLPGPEDCDGEGKVWAIAELNAWMRVHHSMISRWKAWLPANALPLPAPEGGEVS